MLSAVTKAVKKRFPDIKIAKERLEQKAGQEFFFISEINREQNPDFGNAHNRYYFFDIRYHPDDKSHSQNTKIAEVSEGLYECLTYIETDDQPAKATRLYAEPKDGVLHFFVDYFIRVHRTSPQLPDMQELDVKEHLKED